MYMRTVLGSPQCTGARGACTWALLGSPTSNWKDTLLYTLQEILLWTKAWIQQGRDGYAKRSVGYHVI